MFEGLGRGLVVEPFLASGVLGAHPIVVAGTEAQKALLEDVIGGTLLLALAHGEPDSRYETARVSTRAEQAGEHGTLSWEIRSVNHRYLETLLRLPEELRALDPVVMVSLA